MALNKLAAALDKELQQLRGEGRAKGKEDIIVGVKKPQGDKGPRYLLKGKGDKEYIRFNSNSYLGMSLDPSAIAAEEKAVHAFGVGPGAVRFINGTFEAHRDLEKRLAQFHGFEDAVIFSCAYATMIGVFNSLTSAETVIISDELNHNCIINAMKLSRPKEKMIYKHNNMQVLEQQIKSCVGICSRVLIVTDGIFSMRGDFAPLDVICGLAEKYDASFPENIVIMVDDSHGVGAFGETGRGTLERTNARGVDVLIGTLGKAFGVNGGYVVTSLALTRYIREKAITYIYSNPITVGEAAACGAVLDFIDSPRGRERLQHVRTLAKRFADGCIKLGFEIIESGHPIVPLMIRDTKKTSELVAFFKEHGVLTTGLNFPVVPNGDQTIRCQVNGSHTAADIDDVLSVLKKYRETKTA
ncbi:MAG: aminotransferase class I/II-fold pyridoxal phosphate-dependent enzyme [Chitinispirillaceae bacterium]|nr:aminotransferase class I/II-fold pyridoxal phosphate-dependent enzyme [Chitinispirillaceae bacterium]